MHRLREVGPEFVDTAPKRYVVEQAVDASPAAVFGALSASPSTWKWFPAIADGGYEGDPPYGVGTGRWVRTPGVRFRETVVEWEEPWRYAYRGDEVSRPVVSALLERWTIEPRGADGSVVQFTMAVDPRLMWKLLMPAPNLTLKPLVRRAVRNLEAQLRAAPRL